MKIPTEIIEDELVKSFARQGKEIRDLCMTFNGELPEDCLLAIKSYQGQIKVETEHDCQDPHCGKECFPTVLLARSIVEHTAEYCHRPWETYVVAIFAIMYCVLPYIAKY